MQDVFVWEDSCNVYAVIGAEGALIVDAGTGQWLDHLHELPAPPVALACTHFFRDHSAGAARAARAGIRVYVPEGEAEIFVDPAAHFRQRDTYLIYDNYWDLFAPIEATAIAGVLRDYERRSLAGIDLRVLPLPGVAITQIGLELSLPGRDPIVFVAEAIHSPGRMARVAPLQYNYNDLGGAVNAFSSAAALRALRPAALLPSLGTPILERCDAALAQLQDALRELCAARPEALAAIELIGANPLIQLTEHVWRTGVGLADSLFIVSESGRVLAIDYGYSATDAGHFAAIPSTPKPHRRRALLHSLEALRNQAGVSGIDVALITHFHDDHVSGVPLLQRLFGTQCWVPETFAHLLEHPDGHCFPCTWPRPRRVDRRLPLDTPAQWEEYRFHFGPLSGHTRFAALIGFEADGRRFAHTGDQYSFQERWTDPPDEIPRHNHVYRNGALLGGYMHSAAWLRAWAPDLVVSGHWPVVATDAAFFGRLDARAREYDAAHRRIMPLGDQDAHFNLDSWGGWIWPYRTYLPAPGPAAVTATVRNPLPHAATLEVRLIGPVGWVGTAASLVAPPRAEVSCDLVITPDGSCRRQPFALDLAADGRPFGQVAEALLTVGGERF